MRFYENDIIYRWQYAVAFGVGSLGFMSIFMVPILGVALGGTYLSMFLAIAIGRQIAWQENEGRFSVFTFDKKSFFAKHT
jgi:hypothetical protein